MLNSDEVGGVGVVQVPHSFLAGEVVLIDPKKADFWKGLYSGCTIPFQSLNPPLLNKQIKHFLQENNIIRSKKTFNLTYISSIINISMF